MNFEEFEAYTLAGIGLIKGIGSAILREITYRYIMPEGLLKVDMESLTQTINEEEAYDSPK